MEKLIRTIVATTLLMSSAVFANDITLNPNIPGEDTLTITCDYPLTREDGTALALNDIAQVNFYVQVDDNGTWIPAGTNSIACQQAYDLTDIAVGKYIYATTVIDTSIPPLESAISDSRVTLTVVKPLAAPTSPTNLLGAGS